MTTAGFSLVLGTLTFAFFVPLSVASDRPVTIPTQLRSASARVSVSSTSCSVTCGLGYKVEETCEVGPDGKRKNCRKRRLDCLTNWICGMHHFTAIVGEPFELSCLSSREIGPETQSFGYSWRLARGIITADDTLFMPFKTPTFIIKFSPAEESDAGTYRCDVQLMKTYKLIKRIYFGLRVIPGHLVDLNFDQSLTEEQKLESGKEKKQQNTTSTLVPEERQSWRQRAVFVFLLGIGSGVLGGVLLHILLSCLLKSHSHYEHAEE